MKDQCWNRNDAASPFFGDGAPNAMHCIGTTLASRPPTCPCPPMYLQVIATFTVLEDIKTLDEMTAFIQRKSADIDFDLDGFTISLPMSLTDYSDVSVY